MIRFSEAVLPGHPDKFCDFVADAIVQQASRIDRDAYAPGCDSQLEVAVEQSGRDPNFEQVRFAHSALRDSLSPEPVYKPLAKIMSRDGAVA